MGVFDGCVVVMEFDTCLPLKTKTAWRKKILDNGGTISYVLMKKATFLVVFKQSSINASFKIRQALRYKVPVVHPHFIDDCLEQKTLLEPSSYTAVYNTEQAIETRHIGNICPDVAHPAIRSDMQSSLSLFKTPVRKRKQDADAYDDELIAKKFKRVTEWSPGNSSLSDQNLLIKSNPQIHVHTASEYPTEQPVDKPHNTVTNRTQKRSSIHTRCSRLDTLTVTSSRTDENLSTHGGHAGYEEGPMCRTTDRMLQSHEPTEIIDSELDARPTADFKIGDEMLSEEGIRTQLIEELLCMVKTGNAATRKSATRNIKDHVLECGAADVLKQIAHMLMDPNLQDDEHYKVVKVLDIIVHKLEDLDSSYLRKVLIVTEPCLIDENTHIRKHGRKIISRLAKITGLANMLTTMVPDMMNEDEYVRHSTALALAVVVSSLGVPSLLPFLKAACASTKSWMNRHTAIKCVQHTAILIGGSVLPHLTKLVDTIQHGLVDRIVKVRTVTALAIASLAQAISPFGIESFDSVLKPLWKGIRIHRGRLLNAFMKAMGSLIPIMDFEYAAYYTAELMPTLNRESSSPDCEMQRTVNTIKRRLRRFITY